MEEYIFINDNQLVMIIKEQCLKLLSKLSSLYFVN